MRSEAAEATATTGASLGDALRSREWWILVYAVFCLYLLMEYGRTAFFHRNFGDAVRDWPYPELWPFVWVSVSSVVTRMVLPLLFIVFVLRASPRDFGYRLNGTAGLGRIYLALLAFMVPLLWIAAGTEAFQNKYPLFHGAGDSWTLLLLWELRYFFVFLSGESFWRGFLVHALFPRFGWHALSISMLPYVMVHYGKPPIETLGACVTGYVLGYLALRHRSFWLGVVLHFSIAILMDLFALTRTGALPTHW